MMHTLRPAVFHILLALADGRLHGLGIADRIETTTGGAVELGPGTLYRSLKELARRGLIRDADPPENDTDPRRRYYALTPEGRALVAEEAARLDGIVRVARERNLLPDRA